MKITGWIVGLITSLIVVESTMSLEYPDHFPQPKYDFTNNPLKSETIELGRILFYDPILSLDSTISCGSCHSPFNSFAHTDHNLSHGIGDSIGIRNAPPIYNLAWRENFMWDGAVNHLDVQALAPISNPLEMGETLQNVIKKLKRSDIYPELFFQAFGDSTITGERLLKSVSQFQLTLVSANSKYDKVIQGTESFTTQEENGYQLFKANCNVCHREPLFTNDEFMNNGLPVDTFLHDGGRINVTMKPEDSLKFKVPSLRNLKYTFPYMHDGRFQTLNQVLKHYSDGIIVHDNLSKELKTPMNLSANDRIDIISFLLTLNDNEFNFNPKHQFPRNILLRPKE